MLITLLGILTAGGILLRHPLQDTGNQILRQTALPAHEQKAGVTVATSPVPPKEWNLSVPFIVQAPFGNWDLPYQEACEEASVLMVDAFFKNKNLSESDSQKAIQNLVDWENKRFGFYKDTTAEQTALMLKEYFGYSKVFVRYDQDVTVEAIKKEIRLGNLVLLPAAGRLLGNPYFHAPGPLYHMLVVKGWTKDGRFITNDPGTKRGKNFLYKPAVLMNAVHDWNVQDITKGRKAMIVVEG